MSAREFIWQPSDDVMARSRLGAFLRQHDLPDYPSLNKRADADPDWFWNAVISHFDIRFETPYAQVLDVSEGLPWAKWCVGGRTNLTTNCLDRHMETETRHKLAIVHEGEDGRLRTWTYEELHNECCRLAALLRRRGVGKGDVVAIYMPMIPETAAALFAIAKIGAIALPMFSGFGSAAIAERMAIARAVAVITVDGTQRRGRVVPMKAAIDQAAPGVPSLRHVVVLRHAGIDMAWDSRRDIGWDDAAPADEDGVHTEAMDAEDPVMIMFTSGTTGRPKGTVHTHCGVLAKNALDMGLCIDVGADDRLMWMSDIGWMVGPKVIVSSTLLGATMVLADGAPDYPEADRLWRLASEHRVTVMGVAPTVVRTMMTHGTDKLKRHDLSRLRVATSAGEPWDPESWTWFFRHICRGKAPILNYSGGTEVGGAILIGTLHQPLNPCAFGGSVPGHGADAVDENGQPIAAGEVGELVMRRPSIGLTRGLWDEPGRYLENYWSKFPDVWTHGDWATIDADGLWYIRGRADDVIKLAGKRTGPAEIEAILIATGEVAEAAAVGVPDPVKGEVVVCVCVSRGQGGDAASKRRLETAIVDALGRPFRPNAIYFVKDLPKTRNQKIMRRVVRAVLTGAALGDLTSLVNPEAIDQLREVVRTIDQTAAVPAKGGR